MFAVFEVCLPGDVATAETGAWKGCKRYRHSRERGQGATGKRGVFCLSVEGQYKVRVDNCQGWGVHERQSALLQVSTKGPSHLSRHCLSCQNVVQVLV